MVVSGLEAFIHTGHIFRALGKKVGLLSHPASITRDFVHAFVVLQAAGVEIMVLFGPEHGFLGALQDMASINGRGCSSGLPVVSLYGSDENSLSPAEGDLRGLDLLIVDLADVGSRYYTFVWSALLCLRVCHRVGIEMILLDRPNPLGGKVVEGAPQQPEFLSFVGLFPVANRHGMTPGEIVRMAALSEGIAEGLVIEKMAGWNRSMTYDETGLPWVMPSPNMPTLDTARVYPGLCLLESTQVSEGRGTTRPFELFGAPGIDPESLKRRLDAMHLDGVLFRPVSFQPGFQKHADRLCGGVQLHITDPARFKPYRTGVAALLALKQEAPEAFAWRHAPYEFETRRPAIDLLSGSPQLRLLIDSGSSLEELAATWEAGERAFAETRAPFLLY